VIPSLSVHWLSREDGASVTELYNLLEERAILATKIIASTFETSAHIGVCPAVLIKCRVMVLIIELITTNSAA
jgi:hypothetical protein